MSANSLPSTRNTDFTIESRHDGSRETMTGISNESIPLKENKYIDGMEGLHIYDVVNVLCECNPDNIEEYNKHLYTILRILNEQKVGYDQEERLVEKLDDLINNIFLFTDVHDPVHAKVHTTVERCFDSLIKLASNSKNLKLATKSIRFLTFLVMNLNYWELYNILSWRPSLYHFLSMINFNLHECYSKFIHNYAKYDYLRTREKRLSEDKREKTDRNKAAILARESDYSRSPSIDSNSAEISGRRSPLSTRSSSVGFNTSAHEYDKPHPYNLSELSAKEKKKINVDSKLAAHRIIKKSAANKASKKSSNYDPDVLHECQLASPDEPGGLCLRKFSRKYELIRHQETVHSKKKKLFKCYVCVKQNPAMGPRIFTRHDTLAKHIRVNHKISGREAKAEVAYSKKNAEIVEEGDITVHVGRRKTKVDFELRAHMEKRRDSKNSSDNGSEIMEEGVEAIADSPSAINSQDELSD